MIELVVLGVPAPQGSKNAKPIYRGKKGARQWTGKIAMFESASKTLKPWRAAVKETAQRHIELLGDEWRILDCPIIMELVCTFAKPPGTQFRDAPAGPPDLSKIARSTEDALTDAGIWKDDARVVRYSQLAKVWANDPNEPDALEVPGAIIRIHRKAHS